MFRVKVGYRTNTDTSFFGSGMTRESFVKQFKNKVALSRSKATSHDQPPMAHTPHTDDNTNDLPMPGHGMRAAGWITETMWQMCHVVQMVMTHHHHRVCSSKEALPFPNLFSHPNTGATLPTGHVATNEWCDATTQHTMMTP